jgi:hypothetical protein
MALTHDSYTFTGLAGVVRPDETFELPLQIGRFAGVQGELHLVGKLKGRQLRASYILSGNASVAALNTAVKNLSQQAGQLTGTLTQDSSSFQKCTFLGYFERDRFVDGSGVNGWVSQGFLIWRQREIAS